MTRFTLPILATLLLALPATAQMPMPEPPKELAKLDGILGHWEGEGTAAMAPGTSMPWTSRSIAKKVMGGHFVREDTIIDAGGLELAMITYYGWDAKRQRFISYGVNNMGQLNVGEMEAHANGLFVGWNTHIEAGARMSERWHTKVEKDKVTFEGLRLATLGEAFVTVSGINRRVEKVEAIDMNAVGGFLMAGPAADEMKKINRIAGDYVVKGGWRMSPDAEMVPFEGNEKIWTIFGGHLLVNHATGPGYETFAIQAWNPTEKHYDRFTVGNSGSHMAMSGRFLTDQAMAFTFAGEMMGQHMMTRSIIKLDDAGRATAADGHTIMGAMKPFHSFQSTYELKKGTKTEN